MCVFSRTRIISGGIRFVGFESGQVGGEFPCSHDSVGEVELAQTRSHIRGQRGDTAGRSGRHVAGAQCERIPMGTRRLDTQ